DRLEVLDRDLFDAELVSQALRHTPAAHVDRALALAFTFPRCIPNEFQADPLMALLLRLAELGEFDRMIVLAGAEGPSEWRDQALSGALLAVPDGQLNEALQAAESILNSGVRAETLARL